MKLRDKKSNLKVYDNFLSDNYYKVIHDRLFSDNFPWFYTYAINPEWGNPSCNIKDNWQLQHTFYNDAQPTNYFPNSFQLIIPLLDKINCATLYRVKANLNPRASEIIKHGFHSDTDNLGFECVTAIYYVNTNNGYTEFEDGTKVESVANRLITFDSPTKHTGTTCTDQRARSVINLNYPSLYYDK